MELNLHPLSACCAVSGREFREGDRVVCYLVREPDGGIGRRDLLEAEETAWPKPDFVLCRWVVVFKARQAGANPERALKITAENLFLTLADPAGEPNPANIPLLQFLALMLERKKLIKLRGVTEDGLRQVYEHMPSHQFYEVPVGVLDEGFFRRIQEHLGVLVGEPKPKPEAVASTTAPGPAAGPPAE
ncbi:MAG: hypothetical protein PHQ04_08780 [Opitutaceae bacterium]|nr:hypothetical protein [Opitutaceae bacterium]